MIILSQTEISYILQTLTPDNASHLLTTLSTGLAKYSTQKSDRNDTPTIHQPHRSSIVTADQDTVLIMPVSDSNITSVKVVTVPNRGDIKGAITLYAKTGELKGVLNAAEITAFRTALTTLTLLSRIKELSASEIVVFGAGKQTEWHIRLVLKFLSGIKRITVINRSQDRLRALDSQVLEELRCQYPDVRMETVAQEGNEDYETLLQERLTRADVICCCTPSKTPLFTAETLKDRTKKPLFISLIGSYKPDMQEIDTEAIFKANEIWVDSKEACLAESGELIRAKIREDQLQEIGELFMRGSKAMVESQPELIVFKCVGMGIMDLVMAEALIELADKLGKGTKVENF